MQIDVSEASQTGDARRKATALAEELRLDSTRCGAVAIAASEMATNLVKHASGGQIFLQRLRRNGASGMRLISVDKGPGIPDVSKALSDGHSTAGSLGTGLGAIRRLGDHFDLYSAPDAGTVISIEFWNTAHKPPQTETLEVGVISEPIREEQECGDGWGMRTTPDSMMLMVVDGSGHGPLAAEAAREAEIVFSKARTDSLKELIEDTHAALQKTRGAAFGVAKVQFEKRVLTFSGVGNIAASIVEGDASRGLASHNGTLGQQMARVQEFSYPWNAESVLVMQTDGLSPRWNLSSYPGILKKAPSVIAGVLYRDFCRGRDDATVLVAKTA